jgi:hypothetical protein
MHTSQVRSATALLVALLTAASASSEPVPVRFSEGLVHGFLKLSSADGSHLADGDLLQTAQGNRVTSRLVFHFKDGSLQDETSVFSQRQRFRLLSYHLKQKGPAFPRPLEMSIDDKGQATVQHSDEHGERKTEIAYIDVPPDLANGMILTLLKNVRPETAPKELSMIVATPKPRLVKLKVVPSGEERFTTGEAGRKAVHYTLKVDIGGLQGLIAPLLGKQPPDSHVWILQGPVPAFVKSEAPLYLGGPSRRIELVSPTFRYDRYDRYDGYDGSEERAARDIFFEANRDSSTLGIVPVR